MAFLFFLAAITNTIVYQKKTLHVVESKEHRGTDVPLTSVLTNTYKDKETKCIEHLDHLHCEEQDKKKNSKNKLKCFERMDHRHCNEQNKRKHKEIIEMY